MEKYLTLPAETGNKKWVRIATCVFIVALMVVLMTVTAFADPSDAIVTGVKTGTKAIYTIITAIVAPIAAIVLSATALKALIGDARDIEAMKKKVFLIVIVVAVIWLAGRRLVLQQQYRKCLRIIPAVKLNMRRSPLKRTTGARRA